ncbi:hypothetical protein [Microvirga aerophila]|uniref:hypothetical protein n=1 Tax=Microvirga aerophila TaxID=670291 RepID=UPI000DEF806E|nr:hypothetical protein [Microvirga aerophila]
MTGTYKEFLSALALSESSNRYNFVNSLGFAGAYQFGEAALRMVGYYKLDGTNSLPNDWNGGWTGKDGISTSGRPSTGSHSPSLAFSAALIWSAPREWQIT